MGGRKQKQKNSNYQNQFRKSDNQKNNIGEKDENFCIHHTNNHQIRQPGRESPQKQYKTEHSQAEGVNYLDNAATWRYLEHTSQEAVTEHQQSHYCRNQHHQSTNIPSGHQSQEQSSGSESGHQSTSRTQYQPPRNHSQSQYQQKRGAHQPKLGEFTCPSCCKMYNHENRIPRNLHCGHSMCTTCIEINRTKHHEITCQICSHIAKNVLSVGKCSINQSLLKLIPEEASVDSFKKKDLAKIQTSNNESSYIDLCPTAKQQTGIPTVTIDRGSKWKNQQMLNKNTFSPRQELPAKSPHSSQCLENGIRPTLYCIKCKQWVCKQCADVDHSKGECALSSSRDAIEEKKQQNDNTAKATSNSLSSSLKELEKYDSQLEGYILFLRAAYEYIGKKHELVKAAVKDGTQIVNKLEAEVLKLPEARNIPEALAQFQKVNDECAAAQQWLSQTPNTGNGDKIKRSFKDILSITFECLQTLKTGNGTPSQMFVFQDLPSGKILSELQGEGGRIHLYSLTPRKTMTKESRMLPLDCIVSYLNHQSTLTFLDLSWRGCQQGRVYVRLTGDTQRGRQFTKLCTGETGPSFRGTHFHRVWWKGFPGEHIWAGDHNKGDGSGGQTIIESNKENHMPTEPGRHFPITAGLVAGRYEKKNISSVFRIYTKGAKDVMEEVAFGQVEYGLNLIEEATKLRNICDVTIHNCGVVLEV